MSDASTQRTCDYANVQLSACARSGAGARVDALAGGGLSASSPDCDFARGGNLLARATAHLKSQRGASFAMALLLILVCIAISSIVLAASTASAGWMVDRGEMDQRYYSVTSAARLFQGSIGVDDECTFAFEQTKEGTRAEGASDDEVVWDKLGDADGSPVKITITSATRDGDSIAEKTDFNFLTDITRYALFGKMVAKDEELSCPSGASWIEVFKTSWSPSDTNHYVDIKYTVAPSASNENGSALKANQEALTTYVTARLWDDWVLELDFSSGEDADSTKVNSNYHLYMSLAADVNTSTTRQEELVNAGSSVVNNVTDTRTTEVKWRLQQIVPGRGIAS